MVVALGCTAVLPELFGVAGREFATASWLGRRAYALRTVAQICVSREFSLLATGRSSPVVQKLRKLAAAEHERCGGPGVGVIGMCFTGGFALAMAVDARVLAPVLSQPSLPATLTRAQGLGIDCEAASLDTVAGRCAKEGLEVLGLRFRGDPWVPGDRFRFLREKLGDGFVQVELAQSEGNPHGPSPHRHSVLTTDLIERVGEPTYEAREKVLRLFRDKLLGGA
jgi:dienelactone hydrolase